MRCISNARNPLTHPVGGNDMVEEWNESARCVRRVCINTGGIGNVVSTYVRRAMRYDRKMKEINIKRGMDSLFSKFIFSIHFCHGVNVCARVCLWIEHDVWHAIDNDKAFRFHFTCLCAGMRAKDSNSSFATWAAKSNDKRKHTHTNTYGPKPKHQHSRICSSNLLIALWKTSFFLRPLYTFSIYINNIGWVSVCRFVTKYSPLYNGHLVESGRSHNDTRRGVRQHLLDLWGFMRKCNQRIKWTAHSVHQVWKIKYKMDRGKWRAKKEEQKKENMGTDSVNGTMFQQFRKMRSRKMPREEDALTTCVYVKWTFFVDVWRISILLSPFSKLVRTVPDTMRQLNRQLNGINFSVAYFPVRCCFVKCIPFCSKHKICVRKCQSIFLFCRQCRVVRSNGPHMEHKAPYHRLHLLQYHRHDPRKRKEWEKTKIRSRNFVVVVVYMDLFIYCVTT